ncbi:hypothetical protein EYZ11_010521 [Aspergillus tanneri]|nr:hypothetical protein EYZ11_010521 [Aspergillus tanneri]
MYSVKWDVCKRPKNIPADKLSKQLQDMMPVAIGTTPLDSLLAYVKAHQEDEQDDRIKNVMKAIENIQKHLLVQEDTVDGQEQAEDILYNFNFDNFPGGTRYHIASAPDYKKPTVKPEDTIVDKLACLNREQVRLDSLDRTEQRLQWDLFSVWWSFVSSGIPAESDQKEALTGKIKSEVNSMMKDKDAIHTARQQSRDRKQYLLKDEELKGLIDNKIIAPSVHPNFHTQQDPTLLVGHIQSAWPHDWLDPLFVRVNTDIIAWKSRDKLGEVRNGVGIDKLPKSIQETAAALTEEFIELTVDQIHPKPAPPGTLKPLYHDTDPRYSTRRDGWDDTQPFFPLFLEWEAEYGHIDYMEWSLEERKSCGQGSTKLSYGIKSKDPLYGKDEWNPSVTPKLKQNIRILSGRVLILPQASLSLYAQVKQMIDQTPEEELKKALGDMDPEVLLQDVGKLAFLSSPLSGFHDHLLTMSQGTHIKPTFRQPGGKLEYIKEATSKEAGFLDDRVVYMGTETDLTPYAGLVPVSTETKDSPFKPVTHGQFKITKLNVIDKFGQVIHALDPRWDAAPQNLRPCLSEFFGPQSLANGTPNIVEKPLERQQGSHYAQIPPHINQLARVNSSFVIMDSSGEWIPQNEWDKPIWGWLVYNYLDQAIQFFHEDGTFYREVRVAGDTGATKSEKWLPFKNTDDVSKGTNQLDYLIDRMAKSRDYLAAILDMIGGAMDYAAAAPDSYAQFLNSIIGRPLALVNMGWSLELGTNEYVSQSGVHTVKPVRKLLQDPGSTRGDQYSFPLKLGDKNRSYDGLVGYFKTLPLKQQTKESYLNLENCYTFFGINPKADTKTPLIEIKPNNFPSLEPFYIDPVKKDAKFMERERNRMLANNTFGAIVDPFRPVHGYTSILPIQALKIPEWTWQEALSRMTAFFHFGPLSVTKDVPSFNKHYLLTKETRIKDPEAIIPDAISLPKMGAADWTWLQPYSEILDGDREDSCFMPLGIAGAGTKPKFEDGPYTSVEGYMQLRQSIVRE